MYETATPLSGIGDTSNALDDLLPWAPGETTMREVNVKYRRKVHKFFNHLLMTGRRGRFLPDSALC